MTETISIYVDKGCRALDENPMLRQKLFEPLSDASGQDRLPRTFVLLEAARYFGLPEVLENQDAAFQCLFRGHAKSEMADVAPYIAHIGPNDDLTTKLLTGSEVFDPPWMMWSKRGAVFLRSTLNLDDLARHFRKFTRIFNTETSRWNYFRFFAPETMLKTVTHMDSETYQKFGRGIDMFLVPDGADKLVCLHWADRKEAY